MNVETKQPRPTVHTIPQDEINRIFVGLEEQVQAVEREIKLRRRVYPRQVSNGRMTMRMAVFQIAAMQEVLRTVQAAQAQFLKDRSLF